MPTTPGRRAIMRPVFHRLYVHVVWTTRGRAPVIDAALAGFLCRVLRGLARKDRCYLLEIGIVQTHVHVLARIRPTTRMSALVQRLKGASAALAGQAGLEVHWAKGYSAQSVSPKSLGPVRDYVRGQPRHHPAEAIPGWAGDPAAEYDATSLAMPVPRDPRG
jgi:REP element-mobilizing transposase RayT